MIWFLHVVFTLVWLTSAAQGSHAAEPDRAERAIGELVQRGAIIKRFEVRHIETAGQLVRLKAQHLDEQGCVTSEVLQWLSQIPEPSLEFRNVPIGDEGVAMLLQQVKPIGLDVSGCRITSKALASMVQADSLRMLDLSFTRIGDDQLERLTELRDLRYLSLVATSVSDTGFSQLGKLKSLREIYVSKTNVTASAMETFRKRLPRCRVRM